CCCPPGELDHIPSQPHPLARISLERVTFANRLRYARAREFLPEEARHPASSRHIIMTEAHMKENDPRRYEPAFPPAPSYFAWPFIALAAAGEALAMQASQVARMLSASDARADQPPKFAWSASNRVRLEMSTMELRDFSCASEGVPTLVCAPFAL